MLRLAGFSAGRGDCARGGLVCGAKQVCCGVFRSDHDRRAFLLECLAFDSRLPCVPVGMFFLRSRLLFAACASNRTACDMLRSYSAVGRDRHSCVLESPVRLSVFPPVHFGPVRFLMAIPTGNEETRERGERSRRRGARALLREHIGFAMFSAGSTLGQNVEAALRPPWTLFI